MMKGSKLLAATGLAFGLSLPTFAQVVIGDVYSADAAIKGTIMLVGSGTRVFSGSQVAAGGSPAVLKLARGGEVRICPGTNLTVSASAAGTEMLFSVSTGALEFHYALDSGADSIMTPDFQLRLAGRGEYHIGIGADERGATCVRGLQRNSGPIAVFETLGDGRYQVQPHEEVVFRDGRVNTATAGALVHCGCPEPPPVMRTESKPQESAASQVQVPQPALTTKPAETHVQVEAPFVFQGDRTQPDISYQVLKLTARNGNDIALKLVPTVTPPPELAIETMEKPKAAVAVEQKKSGGFFKKLGNFFSKMFRG
jgi:hypothetical protein